ncbi:MAG: flavodoxin-dependent (E)-4-hydroxy-3-methylbut-2-enyl-diphosphate synthase [Verrucomicrobiota bacterium]|nr:flavodoxin-dependent (E)-4-hydroxy-3-methylbut-2-enyl-diphosphate synthase [Verrucomicrobiota bacterium]
MPYCTRQVFVGRVPVGGGAPVSVQTMTKTDTRDVSGAVAQIREVESLGCDIARLAVPDEDAAKALVAIRKQTSIPLIADIHFNHRLALAALDAGLDGLRINPGTIGSPRHVKELALAAESRRVPIRIGVNAGSLEKELLVKHGGITAEALVESALGHVRLLEEFGFARIKISVKASDARRTVEAYRLLAERTNYPLHLGVTEAGTFLAGTVRSCVALGILLSEGIGDTIRVSLTDTPAREVRVGLELLRSLGLREPGSSVTSCPTCGRIEVDVIAAAGRIEEELDRYYRQNPKAPRPMVAVMGCRVNGPGEALEADIAIAGGRRKFALYVKGEPVATVSESEAVASVLSQVRQWKG